ncbi:MAG: type II secretion system protein GspM [Pseudomonas sp.]
MAARVDRDRWLALGLLLAALALAYLLLVHPWFTQPLLALEDELQELRERDLRVSAQLAQAPQVAQRLRQARQQLEARPGFLTEASAELASAGLVQRLERAVLKASPGNRSCAISNRSPLPGDAKERFPRVAVQVRLRCGTPELAAVLYALESGSPRLFVDNLNVMAQRYELSPNESGSGLDVAFELAGYLRPSVAPAPVEAANAH